MRTVSAREANQAFSRLLGEAEAGEELVITRRGKPVATLAPYREPAMTSERRAAVERAIAMMDEGLPIASDAPRPPFTREEMHER
jgi:prevent-host-death family protein